MRRTERAAKPFDVATKHLLESDPRAWLAYVDLSPTGPVEVIDADLSTVLAEADKVLRIDDPVPWLAHFELQAGRDPTLGLRVLQYNVLLARRHGRAVESVVVLLRPAADGPEMSGLVHLDRPDGTPYLEFRHRVVRAWQQPVEPILAGGLGTLPLAPLADVPDAEVPAVIRHLDARLRREAAPDEVATLWAATYWLLGLRFPASVAQQLLQGVHAMRESSTYQAVLDEGRAEGEARGRAEGEARGRAEGARRVLLRLGTRRFGPPDRRARAALQAIADVEQIEQLSDRVLDVASWAELLETR